MKKANGEIKIESGIKPPHIIGRGRPGRYPYMDMKVGDSFLIPPGLKVSTGYNIAREGNRQALTKGQPHRFRAGKSKDGYRCWRIE